MAGCCRSKYRVPIHYLKNSGSYTTNQSSYVRNVSINSRGFFCVSGNLCATYLVHTTHIRIIYVLMRRSRGYLPKSGAKYQVIGFTKKTIINLPKMEAKNGALEVNFELFYGSFFVSGRHLKKGDLNVVFARTSSIFNKSTFYLYDSTRILRLRNTLLHSWWAFYTSGNCFRPD